MLDGLRIERLAATAISCSVVVEAEMTGSERQPGGEARSARWIEGPQSPESILAQLLEYMRVAIHANIAVAPERPRDGE